MTHEIRVEAFGGPEVLRWTKTKDAAPGRGEALVRNQAIGLNFLDVYLRSGRYQNRLPFVPGHEGAGVVEEVGEGVADCAPGDLVAYIDPAGAYAERVIRPANRLIKLPLAIDARAAASMMLKGMTAEYLLKRTFKVKSGDFILAHAAAGGVGQILCQWAKHLGATVIGTVGSAPKKAIAERAGCDHVIVLDREDFVARVREITSGRGVSVVYDGVGLATFARSLDCLAPRGLLAAYGAASGPIPPLDVQSLATKGSLYVTRPGIRTYTESSEELRASAQALFDVVASGGVKIDPPRTFPLRDAAVAHTALEARQLTGSTVLLP
ncbi:MAG: quinone oxidoreductase [Hyphomonadaceae bacterium]